ncbi:glycogen debranching protein GlgX [soil metagenome]
MAEPNSIGAGESAPPGVTLRPDGVDVAVVSHNADRIDFCVFDTDGREARRVQLRRTSDTLFHTFVAGIREGTLYGLRADGPWDPHAGHRFDPAKLLGDPYARQLDRAFAYHADLDAPPSARIDTADLVPKAIVVPAAETAPAAPHVPPGLIYEVAVRAFSILHPGVAESLRGTIAALAEPAVVDHLVRLGVDTVELMPVAAWIDERHLDALGLTNAWCYNPFTFMAPDPILAPGGVVELRKTVAALRKAGIAVILDAVFNHTGESDAFGPTLSLRGLDNTLYYRHTPEGELVNDTGTGNTLAVERPEVARLVLDSMRHWVAATGIAGFRLDLAATLARDDSGFRKDAAIFAAIEADPVLGRCLMIAEPWDVGPGGYHLGNFPPRWQEWNDRYRDDVRRFWRGDTGGTGNLATRLAGSSDIFAGREPAASVNFVAAHDGFTLADIVAYAGKHNEANGEFNRDGTDANNSWNNGIEGATTEERILAARKRDIRSLLATLFVSRGTPMLTAGDEFGRTQQGNNNAYAQDNEITWLDWETDDRDLIAFTRRLAAFRKAHRTLRDDRFLTGAPADVTGAQDIAWLHPQGLMRREDWDNAGPILGAALYCPPTASLPADRTAVWINGGHEPVEVWLPNAPEGVWWRETDSAAPADPPSKAGPAPVVVSRSVALFALRPSRSR